MVKTIDILGFPHAYELSAPTESPTVLVFLHGWLLSRQYWRPVIQQLACDYQCLAYDLRGFGASQPTLGVRVKSTQTLLPHSVRERASVGVASQGNGSPLSQSIQASPASEPVPLNYTPAAYAQDLNVLLERLGISNAWLVGHSLGGSIALWSAHEFPERIAGVICVNSGGGIYLKEEFERFRAAGQQLVKYRPRWLSYIPLLDMALTRMNVAQPLSRKWGRQRLLDLLMALPEAAIGSLLDSTTEAEVNCLPQVVSQIRQPVHFIAGADDTIMEPKYVHHLASFHPSFECCGKNVSEIPNCGHLAMVEQPDAVVAEIRSVLAKYEGSGE
ncbi:alpha/beta fold hydrolase [Egbenema bharatensis]|uniref:alpha/beta fold hydrolase n=1 Tax=Egbenema bharatensis TaxID=3463334 RepID=UPI003A84A456